MYVIAALYHFTPFVEPERHRQQLLAFCEREGIRGILLLAREGINGTVAGSRQAIDRLIETIRSLPGCDALEWKESHSEGPPFRKLRVRLKQEIVTMGQPDIDPSAKVGHYVAPEDWNALISEPDVVLIDTRNRYETEIGTFQGALDPETDSFRDFPGWWKENASKFEGKKIAMFCTGGIRCEKSTNFLLGQGVDDVFHLKGGILKYLEIIPREESRWEGHCFVFDERVSVGHALEEGPHLLCRACREPILPEDRARPEYEQGVSCHHCYASRSEEDRDRFREREKQIALAKARGEQHLGYALPGDAEYMEKEAVECDAS